VRRQLEQDPNDDRARALLIELRQSVNYPVPDMRPTEPLWLVWPALSHSGKMLAAWCLLLVATLVGWRRRRWMAYLLVAAVSLIAIGVIAVRALLERSEQQRNELQPIVVVAQDTFLRRGNGEEYSPRITAPLPPGAEVRRLFERHGWLQVELANGVVGWLPVGSVIH
jgi:hypothetical protein